MLPTQSLPPDFLNGVTLPPDPQQARSQRKREALIEAALVLFETHGYEATSIETIAQKAEVAVGGFYQHFKSKQQLLLVLMQRLVLAIDALQFPLDPAQPPRRLIEQALRTALALDRLYTGAYRAWRSLSRQDANFAELNIQLESWLQARLRQLLQALTQLPQIRSALDLDQLSWVLMLLFLDLIERLTDETLEMAVQAMTHLIYHALFTEAG